MDCTIILKAPQNSIISFFFNSFDVESHSACQFDYLEVKQPARIQTHFDTLSQDVK